MRHALEAYTVALEWAPVVELAELGLVVFGQNVGCSLGQRYLHPGQKAFIPSPKEKRKRKRNNIKGETKAKDEKSHTLYI